MSVTQNDFILGAIDFVDDVYKAIRFLERDRGKKRNASSFILVVCNQLREIRGSHIFNFMVVQSRGVFQK